MVNKLDFKKNEFNLKELGDLKSFLINKKSSILNKSNEFKSEQASERGSVSEEAEAATVDLDLSLSIQLHERDRMVLYQIERALSKFEDGTYGQCECCSEEIAFNRLKASPFVTLCISCKEEQEDPRNYLQ